MIARGDSVLVLDDLSTGRLENLATGIDSGAVEFVEGSILDEALVAECVAASDVCLHLAAAVGVELILERPLDSLIRNVRGSDIVISAVAEQGGKVLVASSSEVYGKNSAGPLAENCGPDHGPAFDRALGLLDREGVLGGAWPSPATTRPRPRPSCSGSSTRSGHVRRAPTGWSCPGSSARR